MIDAEKLQRRTTTRAVIEIILIANLGETDRAIRLYYRPAHYRIKDLRRRTRVVRQVGCCSSKSVGAVRQWFGRITPCTAVVGGCRPEQHRALEYGHFAVGFCGAG